MSVPHDPIKSLSESVTVSALMPERQQAVKDAVMAAMWPEGDGPRRFDNVPPFIIG